MMGFKNAVERWVQCGSTVLWFGGGLQLVE
jgi:hypothetical protein